MLLKKNEILIFGGAGFVGEYLVRALSVEPNISLGVVDRDRIEDLKKKNNINFRIVDLAAKIDRSNFIKIAKKASSVVVMTQPNEKIIDSILKFCDTTQGLKKIIFISTILVYPSSKKASAESVIPRPATAYEKEKMKEEKLLKQYARKRGVGLCIVRLGNVYGDVKNKGIIDIIFRAILGGGVFIKNGDGRQVRDYIFIEDAIKFIKSLIFFEPLTDFEIFNVCTGRGFTINQLIDSIKDGAGVEPKIKSGPPVKEKSSVVGNNKKIIDILGFKPSFSLSEGLKRTYLNYTNRERI